MSATSSGSNAVMKFADMPIETKKIGAKLVTNWPMTSCASLCLSLASPSAAPIRNAPRNACTPSASEALLASSTRSAVTAMKPLGQATCGCTHLSAGGPEPAPDAEHDHEQQPDEQRAEGQAAACRLARRRDVAEDDGEERPVDEIVDDGRAHDERADRPIEQAAAP